MRAHGYQTFVSIFTHSMRHSRRAAQSIYARFCLKRIRSSGKDEGSADPAVYEEFSKAFDERFGSQGATSEEARSFARDYFSTRNGEYCWTKGDLVAAFDSIVTPQLWERSLEETAD